MLGYQKNFSKLTVSGNYSASDTAITISGTNLAAQIPNSGSGIFSVVWYDHTNYPAVYNDPNKEICRVTGFNGQQTLYLDRGREYTNPAIHSGSTYKMITTPTARGFNNLYYFRNPEKSYYFHEDFLFPHSSSAEGWSRTISSQTTANMPASFASQAFGGIVIPASTGASFRANFQFATNAYQFRSGLMIFEGLMYLGATPATDNDFTFWLGFTDATNNASAGDGAFFVFDEIASGAYLARVADNSVRTDIRGGIFTTGWHKYNVVINQSGNIADFYVDDNLVVSSTGHLTSSVGLTSICFGFNRPASVGANPTIATGIIDYVLVYKELQPPNANYEATGYNFRL